MMFLNFAFFGALAFLSGKVFFSLLETKGAFGEIILSGLLALVAFLAAFGNYTLLSVFVAIGIFLVVFTLGVRVLRK